MCHWHPRLPDLRRGWPLPLLCVRGFSNFQVQPPPDGLCVTRFQAWRFYGMLPRILAALLSPFLALTLLACASNARYDAVTRIKLYSNGGQYALANGAVFDSCGLSMQATSTQIRVGSGACRCADCGKSVGMVGAVLYDVTEPTQTLFRQLVTQLQAACALDIASSAQKPSFTDVYRVLIVSNGTAVNLIVRENRSHGLGSADSAAAMVFVDLYDTVRSHIAPGDVY